MFGKGRTFSSLFLDHCTPTSLVGGEAGKAAAAAVVAATTTTTPPDQQQEPQQQQLPSIHKIMEEDKLKELNGAAAGVKAAAAEAVTTETASPTPAKKLGPLVDYDSDSDEESSASEEDTGNSLPPAKRIKPNSSAPAN